MQAGPPLAPVAPVRVAGELRSRRLTQARIARSLGVSESTVGRVVGRAGLSQLSALEPSAPVVRYEHAAPGDMVHIDTKKLGRIVRTGHRITGDPRDNVVGAGWEFLFVAIDDHTRIAFTQIGSQLVKFTADQRLVESLDHELVGFANG